MQSWPTGRGVGQKMSAGLSDRVEVFFVIAFRVIVDFAQSFDAI
jgi:hypothetical protein